jgi:hypothetical protein
MCNYCKSDVDVLRKSCIKLRELLIQVADNDPLQYITIASLCSAICRNECISGNAIGVVNETPSDSYSAKSIKWLTYVSQTQNINIKHAERKYTFKRWENYKS